MQSLNPILQFVLGTGFATVVSALVVYYSNKGKNSAETEQIAANVYKGLNADLLVQFKDANTEIRRLTTECRDLNQRISQMEEKDEQKEVELRTKNLRIIELERRVDFLENELKKYKPLDEVIDSVATAAHLKIDEAKDEIKSNLTQ